MSIVGVVAASLSSIFDCAGPVMLIQAVVPHMVAKGKGKIVNVGSIGAYTSGPWSGAYSSSKAALHAASDALR